jgi:DNA polymerase III epsilon subunit-like protein
MSNVPLCFVDTETTSLDPHTRAVWEVGLIRREPNGTEKRREFQVELTNREFVLADSQSLEIGNYDERYDPVEAISKRSAAAIIAEFTDGAHLVGMCPDFDAHGLRLILQAAGLEPKWYYQLIDVDTFAQGVFLAKNDAEKYSNWPVNTDGICEELGVTIDESVRHTAMGDAEWTKDMFDAVVNYALEN